MLLSESGTLTVLLFSSALHKFIPVQQCLLWEPGGWGPRSCCCTEPTQHRVAWVLFCFLSERSQAAFCCISAVGSMHATRCLGLCTASLQARLAWTQAASWLQHPGARQLLSLPSTTC